jgi:CPA2 family monovalent cation:H+ antiporter-2
VVVILFLGRLVLRPLLTLAAATGSREIVVAIALLVAIGGAGATAAAGLSPALGAFLGGLLLGSSEYRHQVEVDIEPFKGLLLGLFFMSVGMSIDIAFVGRELLGIVAAVAALLVLKAILVFAVLRTFRVGRSASLETAFLLAGAGEFAFVLFTLARQERLMTSTDLRFVTTVAAISMVLTPVLAWVGKRVAARLAHAAEVRKDVITPEEEALSNHVVLAGYGRVGEVVAQALESAGTPFVALDLNSSRVSAARAAGKPVHFGDASRREMLDRVGAGRAAAFVVTSDLAAETDRTVAAIREFWPGTRIFARARDVAHARRLAALGVVGAVPEAFEGSLTLAERVLSALGIEGSTIDQSIDATRTRAMSSTEPAWTPPSAKANQ